MTANPSRRAILGYLVALVILGTPLLWLMAVSDTDTAVDLVLLFMFVPTGSALLAWAYSKQRIVFGKPNLKTLGLALVPGLLVGGVYAAALLGPLSYELGPPGPLTIFGLILASTFLALGEEIGWRGYLLPQLRRENGYVKANSIVTIIWFIYHVPVIFIPGLYSNPNIPLAASLLIFACMIFGFSFFIGWIWELHNDVWAPALGHGGWNYLVQAMWANMFVTANPWLMGEFGLLPMVPMLALGGITIALVHQKYREPLGDRLYPPKKVASHPTEPALP